MSTIKAGNIRKGKYILHKNVPHQVTKTEFVSPGKGSAFMRAKIRSAETGSTQEYTFKSTEPIEEVEVVSRELQFLYADDTEATFMDPRNFDQISVPVSLIGKQVQLLTSDSKVYVLLYQDKAIGVSLPPKVSLKVKHAEEAAAGNTVGQARKEAELETGMKIAVPIFVKTGDLVVIDTQTCSYVSRG
ncbi:MAG: elongation factor P [Patescibacteria group bacterium]